MLRAVGLPTGRGILVTLAITLDVVTTVSANGDGDVIGIAVGVSLGTSLITTLLTLGIVFLIQKASRSNKYQEEHKEDIKRKIPERNSDRSSASSTRQLTRGHSYEPVSTGDGANGVSTGTGPRYRSDFIARWCTDHGLSEQSAAILRKHGFTSREAVESLRPDIVPRLQLNNIGQECLLRKAITPKHAKPSESSGVYRQKSTSEENVNSITLTPVNHDQSGNSSVFERTQSVDHIDGALPPGRPMPKKKSIGSMEILEGDQTIIIRSNSHEAPGVVHRSMMTPERKSNPKNFKGLLSDQGLHELSAWIGHESSHLATLLEIPPPTMEQLQMDHPKNIRQQIFEMLRLWRDSCHGNKEQVKGVLHKALEKVGRSDLAEDLLMEQVEGSTEKVAYHSIV